MGKRNDNTLPINEIIKNYRELEKSLIAQLNFRVSNHPLTIGGFREDIWKKLFEQIVPKKYTIEQSVFLADAYGKISYEVDLVIMDEMYTPYIFRNGRIKFIPIEAVAAVIQCKSTNVDVQDKEGKYYLRKWIESINDLKTSVHSITRFANDVVSGTAKTQSGTRPIKILCALKKPCPELMKDFDFYIIADNNENIKVGIPHENDWDLGDWHYDLNMKNGDTDYKKKIHNKKLSDYMVMDHQGKTVPLLTLNFQLNQLLMLINNPMPFPHIDYVNMFNRKGAAFKKYEGKDSNKK